MRKIDNKFFLRFVWSVGLFLFVQSANQCFAQWEVKELHTLSGKVTGSDMVIVGKLDKEPNNEIVWLVTEKGGGNRIIILDGVTGEMKWHSEPFFKIFPSSLKIADVDGDNINELIFAGQQTALDAITMYTISHGKLKSVEPTALRQSAERNDTPPQTQNTTENTRSLQETSKPAATAEPPVVQPEPVQPLPDHISSDIPYSLPKKAYVEINIFNGTGDIVRTLVKHDSDEGDFIASWDGTDDKGVKLPLGTYFYTVVVGKTTQVRKPVIFRQ
ncbi:MAG: FlgD immunoglobulin-like domain containing protein [Bacteroidota bacterium]